MKGKEFEKLCLDRAAKDEANGLYTMGRYGVQGNYDGTTHQWRPVPSLPDFEGVTPDGRQFIFDAKVTSSTSLPMKDDHAPARQRKHMLRRSKFGVTCFYLVHCLEYTSPTGAKHYPEMTVALPVDPGMECWEQVEEGTRKSFNRDDLKELGMIVYWTTPNPGDRKKLPNFLPAIRMIQEGITEKNVYETLPPPRP